MSGAKPMNTPITAVLRLSAHKGEPVADPWPYKSILGSLQYATISLPDIAFAVNKEMGRLFVINLEGDIYGCKHCCTHLALVDDIFSKSFHSRHGKAYLFDKAVNVTIGEKEERMMTTGLHIVADIFCVGCGSIVGWKYEFAHDTNQKYKEGKFILERFKVLRPGRMNHLINQEAQVGGSDADDA